jgi:hypothetical protein
MKKHLICISALFIILSFTQAFQKNFNVNNLNMSQSKENFVFATYVSDYNQVRKAFVLIESIRNNASEYSNCTIYIGVPDIINFNFDMLKSEDVKFINLDIPDEAKNYYYAVKAYAAAQIEKSLDKNVTTLAWFDPETIILGSVDDLELKKGHSAAMRPVFLMNKIGLKPDEQPNEFWAPIYDYLNLKIEDVLLVETEVDLVKTRAYFNCGIFSVNPALGIMQEWARVQTIFLKDKEYQKNACSDIMRKIFFHQAVFSCVVCSMLKPDEINSLPMSCGYPLDLHGKVPENKKIYKLNDISCAITEHLWDKNPKWMDTFTANEPLKTWLEHTTQEYLSTAK